MTSFTDGSHNLLFSLDRDRWLKDLTKSATADVCGYQEAEPARGVLTEFCTTRNRGLYFPTGTGNPISWNRALFRRVRVDGRPVQGVHDSHLSATRMGVKAKFNPSRDFSWVGLHHRATGTKVLRINVHPVSQATKPEHHPRNRSSTELNVWKDWAIGQYWLDVVAVTAEAMSLQDPGVTTTAPFWDVVLLGGDFNATWDNNRRWYYPGSLLPALYEPDIIPGGLDHLVRGHGSDVKPTRRWSVSGFTDHRIHFATYQLQAVADFPREF